MLRLPSLATVSVRLLKMRQVVAGESASLHASPSCSAGLTESCTTLSLMVSAEIAADAFNAGIGERGHERFKRLENIPAVQPRVEGRITAPVDDQITLQRAGLVGSPFGVERGLQAVITSKLIQCERDRVKLAVGRGTQ